MSAEKKHHRTSYINLTVSLDQNNVPEAMEWNATDAEPGTHHATALMLALWDKKTKNGLSIDLWTKDMIVPEMNIFFYQTFLSMSDTFMRATQNKELSEEIRKFAKEFMEKVKKAGG